MIMDTDEEDDDFTTAVRKTEGYAPLRANRPEVNNRLLRRAHAAIGTPYVLGGTEPGGFDCSGLVCWAYRSVGVKLPRTAREQSVVGRRIKNVAEMQAGDIVAFRHPRRGYHTGIYVGNGKFIHSPHKRARVRINSLSDPYFSNTFLGARRINVNASENLVAQAENRLRDYTEEKVVRELSRKQKAARKADDSNARNEKRDKRSKRDSERARKSRHQERQERVVASHDRRSSRHAAQHKERASCEKARSDKTDRRRKGTLTAQVEQKRDARSSRSDVRRQRSDRQETERRNRSDRKADKRQATSRDRDRKNSPAKVSERKSDRKHQAKDAKNAGKTKSNSSSKKQKSKS